MSEWQPIETAPKDRRILLLRGDRVEVGKWDDDKYARKPRPFWDCEAGWISKNNARGKQPTHWMPLPEPPTNQGT